MSRIFRTTFVTFAFFKSPRLFIPLKYTFFRRKLDPRWKNSAEAIRNFQAYIPFLKKLFPPPVLTAIFAILGHFRRFFVNFGENKKFIRKFFIKFRKIKKICRPIRGTQLSYKKECRQSIREPASKNGLIRDSAKPIAPS